MRKTGFIATTLSSLALAALVGMSAGACKNASKKDSGQQAAKAVAAVGEGTVSAKHAEGCGIALHMSPDAPIATIGGKPIPCSELYEFDKGVILQAEAEFLENVHSLHKRSLEDLVDDRLLSAAAEKAGQSVGEYVTANIVAERATEEQIQEVYDRTVASGQALPPLEQIRPDLESFINDENKKEAYERFRMKLRDEAKVEMHLPLHLPPTIEVEALGPSKGAADAPVTIVEFSDFECPYCAKAQGTLDEILTRYEGKVRLVFRDLPLPGHARAPGAAAAAHCAGDQGKFWEMHDLLFNNRHAMSPDDLKGYAKDLGLEQGPFDTCIDSGAKAEIVEASAELGAKLGISGTPAFFINGRILSGAQPVERFAEIIDYELAQK